MRLYSPLKGDYLGEPSANGSNGIRIGDSYHDDILGGFVSCNCAGSLPANTHVVNAMLNLHVSRVFGADPLKNPTVSGTLIVVDMVRAFACGRVGVCVHVLVDGWVRACMCLWTRGCVHVLVGGCACMLVLDMVRAIACGQVGVAFVCLEPPSPSERACIRCLAP
jgi:hypothetical protein